MQKPKFPKFNDGVVQIYREKEKRSKFSAKENVSDLDDLEFIAKLDYEECSKREQDLEFANQNDFSLSLKIHTRYLQAIDNHCKAVIDGYLYDIKFVDKTRMDAYLYMEGVKSLVPACY